MTHQIESDPKWGDDNKGVYSQNLNQNTVQITKPSIRPRERRPQAQITPPLPLQGMFQTTRSPDSHCTLWTCYPRLLHRRGCSRWS